jgi:NTP pyrophosphatase (non-canonical NTP hydrolase)
VGDVISASFAFREALRDVTFREVRELNLARCFRWHPNVGVADWKPVQWSNATAGEVGEMCNAVKKLERVEQGLQQKKGPATRSEAIMAIAKELGDLFLYADLTASRLGLRIEDCIRYAFNKTSEQEGFPERIEA